MTCPARTAAHAFPVLKFTANAVGPRENDGVGVLAVVLFKKYVPGSFGSCVLCFLLYDSWHLDMPKDSIRNWQRTLDKHVSQISKSLNKNGHHIFANISTEGCRVAHLFCVICLFVAFGVQTTR